MMPIAVFDITLYGCYVGLATLLGKYFISRVEAHHARGLRRAALRTGKLVELSAGIATRKRERAV